MLFGLFRRRPRDGEYKTYSEIVAQARQPVFYTDYRVPDTLDGRFDLIVAHAVVLFQRLAGEDKAVSEFSQSVFDLFFHDMDASLREMGVTDTRVPKKVKAMGEAFYGRADAYAPCLTNDDVVGLSDALSRNIYTEAPEPIAERALAQYMLAAAKALAAQDTAELMTGKLDWPEPAAFAPGEETAPGRNDGQDQ
ncbi:ubiquinol-cytochrome C chaperone family protein [uncultured Roseibium sp.]|uniref:ubiquinol-cytochrome C chaperone family protein n=1 Tax=uncultured Roseibium sp. TaxID=1936171 RepID=UPI003216B4DF